MGGVAVVRWSVYGIAAREVRGSNPALSILFSEENLMVIRDYYIYARVTEEIHSTTHSQTAGPTSMCKHAHVANNYASEIAG